MTRSFGHCTFELYRGDITTLVVDAIVNAANAGLAGGGGVDGAIHRAAGPDMVEECKAHRGCPTGKAKVTGGGHLPCRYVIHAVGPVWRNGREGEPGLLASAYHACLEHVSELELGSVAFPAISTGIYGFPIKQASEIALVTCRRWVESPESKGFPVRIVFVLFSDKDYLVYEHALTTLP